MIFCLSFRGFSNFSVLFPSTKCSDNDIFVIRCVPLVLDMNNVLDAVVAAVTRLLSVRESIEVTVTIHNLVAAIDDANQFDGKHFAADEKKRSKLSSRIKCEMMAYLSIFGENKYFNEWLQFLTRITFNVIITGGRNVSNIQMILFQVLRKFVVTKFNELMFENA